MGTTKVRAGSDFCLIFAPCNGRDEPEILPYSSGAICPKGAAEIGPSAHQPALFLIQSGIFTGSSAFCGPWGLANELMELPERSGLTMTGFPCGILNRVIAGRLLKIFNLRGPASAACGRPVITASIVTTANLVARRMVMFLPSR